MCTLALEQCSRLRVSARCIHQLVLVVARLPNRVLTDLSLASRAYGDMGVVRLQTMSGIPALYLNNQKSHRWNDHNEIRVSMSDHRLVVDNHLVWKLLQDRKQLLLARARTARKAIGYHFCHAIPFESLALTWLEADRHHRHRARPTLLTWRWCHGARRKSWRWRGSSRRRPGARVPQSAGGH